MPVVVGVNFRPAGRVYSFFPGELDLAIGDAVIAEASRGVDLGWVKHRPRPLPDDVDPAELKQVVRRATEADLHQAEENRARAEQALELARQRVNERGMPMKLLRSEYQLDRTQITIYFAAEGRVDFRELVKDLASVLRTRIQLHQVGARDAAKLLGGIGPCGRALCCSTWLVDFAPVSMKMAKEQSLFLNPTKFSGVCGKLMCCLRYEYDQYRETKAQLPAVGAEVVTPAGKGVVAAVNIVRELVLVTLADGVEQEFPAWDVERPVVRGCAVLQGGSCTGGCASRKE